MKRVKFQPFLLLLMGLLASAVFWGAINQADGEAIDLNGRTPVSLEAWSPVRPLLPMTNLSPVRVELGRGLFRDRRLSGDLSVACVDCHDPVKGGADGRRFSLGVGGAEGSINAPSVFNSGYSFVQFWDGRAQTLEEQVSGPIHNPLEMDSNWKQILERLSADSVLVAAFSRAYPGSGLTVDNLIDALASYERSLTTPNARFDRFLAGDAHAINKLELEGYRRFEALGCLSCHQGMLLGGNMYQRLGVMRDYFAQREIRKADLGRYNVTGRDDDKFVFKVPTLRNVALTAPYFHDGSAPSLEQAVVIMGRYQLGRELSRQDVDALVAFLKTLTGEIPE